LRRRSMARAIPPTDPPRPRCLHVFARAGKPPCWGQTRSAKRDIPGQRLATSALRATQRSSATASASAPGRLVSHSPASMKEAMTDAPAADSQTATHIPDTVEHAAATPDQEMPYAELGLKPDEYARIKDLLGRRPTNAELAMYSVMWSEHCSYKSSKIHLRQFGAKTTEDMKKHLMVGMGENAGVVDIGDGWAVTFKVESHNHPSFVEPYQGAATGVGGIVRDILAMGARPVAVMD